jgi:hypothetical protein
MHSPPSQLIESGMEGYARTHNTAVFIIIEPVDGAGAGRLLVGVLPVRLYRLRRTNMLAAHDRVNIYDTRCYSATDIFSAVSYSFLLGLQ